MRIGSLSVGQRQRVGLARLLCQPGSLVLLDEPDANLDRTGIAMLARLLRELAREKRVALVAHHGDLVEIADRIVSLDKGRQAGDEKRGIALPTAREVAPRNRSGGGVA